MEIKVLIFLFMIACHIFDDFHLQGCLADMKQKSWWDAQTSDPFYRDDYKMALLSHAFSWSFAIHVPFIVFYFFSNLPPVKGLAAFIFVSCMINTVVHAFIDDLKANKKKLNLVQDQLFHIIQILITWNAFIMLL